MGITIHKRMCEKNECLIKNIKLSKVKGIMLHSIGCPQPSAEAMANLYNNYRPCGAQVAVHAFLDEDGDVYQCLPWGNKGWHAGGKANGSHIGVEMTEPAGIKYVGGATWTYKDNSEATKKKVKAHVDGTYKTAVQLFAHLCKAYKLDPLADGVIISHSEGCKRGVASNHGDVEHIWAKFGYTMDCFRKDVKKAMSSGVTVKFEGYDQKPDVGISTGYLAKVTANKLNVRTGAGTNYPTSTTVNKGDVYTIVEEKNGFGKLKSGAGWVSLKFMQKL